MNISESVVFVGFVVVDDYAVKGGKNIEEAVGLNVK